MSALPAASNARAVSWYALLGVFGTFQLQLYGAAVSVHCKTPLTKNSTRVTPTLSLAVAVIVIVDLRATSAPFAGLVIETVGGVVSPPPPPPPVKLIRPTEPEVRAR